VPVELDRTETQVGPPPTTPAPSSGDLPAGKQLDHFRIERKLGAGGMGEVYLATDLALDRPAAVKVLPAAVAADPKRRERMIREARAQARVAHPNVGHMYFIGEAEGHLYFAMEYVAGETLADRIAKGPMPVDDALAVIRAATLGLREAQRSGITHRDVKPSNLMIDGHGIVKVLDFGLAASAETGIVTGPVAQTSLAGTPLYMAPEQARGEAVDFRSDIYALGATLYHLVSGRPPFEAESVEELLSKHATAARPAVPRKGQKRVQAGQLDALTSRMMAARPEDRFASYEDLLRALDLASQTETRPAGFWARGLAMLLDTILVLIIAGIATVGIGLAGLDISDLPLTLPAIAVLRTLTIARWGRSPGQAVMELEVLDVDTLDRPRLSRAVRRSLALFAVPIVAEWVILLFGDARALESGEGNLTITTGGAGLVLLLWALFCLVNLLFASPWISGRRTVWDHAGRTMVRYRTTRRALRAS
jgi:uncharacterized RDD family membrane protein YckC/predicted Ser/Thr protein kinase